MFGPRHIGFFFFNDTATTEIYTLSLHDALPILGMKRWGQACDAANPMIPEEGSIYPYVRTPAAYLCPSSSIQDYRDRKSTRLNSSHANISYAVFCLKKKKRPTITR